jgi:hypothetical protein
MNSIPSGADRGSSLVTRIYGEGNRSDPITNNDILTAASLAEDELRKDVTILEKGLVWREGCT